MYYNVVKHTVIDSMHSEEKLVAVADVTEDQLRELIKELNRQVTVTNARLKLIASRKSIFFRISKIKAFSFDTAFTKFGLQTAAAYEEYKAVLDARNKDIARLNRKRDADNQLAVIKGIDDRDFINPFIPWGQCAREVVDGELADIWLVLGIE